MTSISEAPNHYEEGSQKVSEAESIDIESVMEQVDRQIVQLCNELEWSRYIPAKPSQFAPEQKEQQKFIQKNPTVELGSKSTQRMKKAGWGTPALRMRNLGRRDGET
ncbi:hypothetical protein COOONC_23867 [Cooperia oncophora]